MSIVSPNPPQVAHPLEPLSAAEIERAVAILRREREVGPRTRFASITLREPAKAEVLAAENGTPAERAVELALLDQAAGQTYEATVSLTRDRVTRWEHIPGVQP